MSNQNNTKHPGLATEKQSFLLNRESALAAISIGQGLTLIRKYDFVKHAYGSQAFFMLTIGLERLLKLIYIYNHRKKYNYRFPNNGQLKEFGHDIKSQFQIAKEIADELNLSHLYNNLDQDPINNIIIEFLADFADAARYYNLDTLTGRENKFKEPLGRWDKEVNSIIVERHYKRNLKKEETIKAVTEKLDPIFLVSFSDEEGKNVSNLQDFYLRGLTVEVKQKYSMFYIYSIVRFLSNLASYLDRGLSPAIGEFFAHLSVPDDAYVISRKTWNLYE